ncbi:MAG: DUF4912 domain-containing protein [Candidatus Krumholzibacteriota bacterium]|nr:DUF4912 domain-containing protein [Candidatus Krumholzibacteriota bacterium]
MKPSELSHLKVSELRELAREQKLIGYSQLRKADLVDLIARHLRREARRQAERRRQVAAELGRPLAEIESVAPLVERADTPSAASTAAPAASIAPAPEPPPGEMRDASWYPPELPESYGEDRITLMVRDPHWLFCYWEVTDILRARVRADFSGDPWTVLRIHLLGDGDLVADGWEEGVPEGSRSWYLHTGRPGARFRVELGLKDATGLYRILVASNTVQAPQDQPSGRHGEEWVGLSREAWHRLERTARPRPGSLAGVEFFKHELERMVAARLGGSELAVPSLPRKASGP